MTSVPFQNTTEVELARLALNRMYDSLPHESSLAEFIGTNSAHLLLPLPSYIYKVATAVPSYTNKVATAVPSYTYKVATAVPCIMEHYDLTPLGHLKASKVSVQNYTVSLRNSLLTSTLEWVSL